MALVSHRYPTPLGEMTALFSPAGLCLLEFSRRTRGLDRELAQVTATHGEAQPGDTALTRELGQQLASYFQGELREFDVPLDFVGTAFQIRAWKELLCIPYGQTRSYGEQASRIGRPTAVRAVASANGSNKISVVVPCHRVIGSDGKLTGYGGGLPRKQWLLDMERSGVPPLLAFTEP